jgi:hypothetical protein
MPAGGTKARGLARQRLIDVQAAARQAVIGYREACLPAAHCSMRL